MFSRRQIKKITIIIITSMTLVLFVPGLRFVQKPVSPTADAYHLIIKQNIAHAYSIGDPTVLTKILAEKSGKNGKWAHDLYTFCLGLFNVAILAFLIFIAMANILHYNIQNYAVKAAIPGIIFAVIFANLSMPVFALISGAVDNLQNVKYFAPIGASGWTHYILLDDWAQNVAGGATISSIAGFIAKFFIGKISWVTSIIFGVYILAVGFIGIFVSIVLSFRPYIVLIYAAIAPLAIACSILPFTQQYYKRWITTSMAWLLLTPIAFFILNLGLKLPTNDNAIISGTGLTSYILGFILPSLARFAILILVARLPFKMESDVSGLVGKFNKLVGRGALMGAGQLAYWSDRKQKKDATLAEDKGRKTGREITNTSGLVDALKAEKEDARRRLADGQARPGDQGLIAMGEDEMEAKAKEQRLDEFKDIAKKKSLGEELEKRNVALKKQKDHSEELTDEERNLVNMTPEAIKQSVEQKIDSTASDEYGKLIADQIKDDDTDLLDELTELKNEQKELNKALEGNKTLTSRQKELRDEKFHEKSEEELKERSRVSVAERNRKNYEDEVGAFYSKKQAEDSPKVLNYIKAYNPYGLMSTIQEGWDYEEAERKKTYAKYSVLAEKSRGRYAHGKYKMGVAKEDLSELGTSEEMAAYLKPAFQSFYRNVSKSMGKGGIVDDAVKEEAHEMLRRYRTRVKGLKDYLDHPYFEGLTAGHAAEVIQGDYAVNMQLGRESRRGNLTNQQEAIEQKKRVLFGSGAPLSQEEKRIITRQQESDRKTEALLRQIAVQTTGVSTKDAFSKALEITGNPQSKVSIDDISGLGDRIGEKFSQTMHAAGLDPKTTADIINSSSIEESQTIIRTRVSDPQVAKQASDFMQNQYWPARLTEAAVLSQSEESRIVNSITQRIIDNYNKERGPSENQ